MDHFAGLDVSVKETSVCIVDDAGNVVREVKVTSEPEALLAVLKNPAYRFKRIGLEAGPLSQWLFGALAEAELPVVCEACGRCGPGGLAAWQERRAKEVLSANLDGSVPLKDVARECRLSVSHFSRAFRRTMGVAPHHWLLTRRVEVAKEKLRNTRLPLPEVALVCGFADQSHLTRVFTRTVGVSPGAWRRALDE